MGLIILLFIVITLSLLFINNAYVNSKISKRTSAYFSSEWKTEVALGGFEFGIYPLLKLYDFRLIDQQKDTLAAFSNLSVQIDFSDLLHRKFHITQCELTDGNSVISLDSNNTINVQFIIDYFNNTSENKDTSISDWEFSISDLSLVLDNANFRFYSSTDSIDLFTGVSKGNILLGETKMSKVLMECKSLNISDAFYRMSLFKDFYYIDIQSIIGESAWISPLNFEYIAEKIKVNVDSIDIDLNNIIDLKFQQVALDAQNCKAFDGDYYANINSLTSSVFNNYKEIKISGPARFCYDKMLCNKLEVSTEKSFGIFNSNIIYGSLDNLANLKFTQESFVDLNSSINTKELQSLIDVKELDYLGNQFELSTILKGNRDKLIIRDFQLNTKDSLFVKTKGLLVLLSEIDSLTYNLLADINLPNTILGNLAHLQVKKQNYISRNRIKGNFSSLDLMSFVKSDTGRLFVTTTVTESNIQARVNAKKFPLNIYTEDSLFVGNVSSKAQLLDYNYSTDLSELSINGILLLNKIEINQNSYKGINVQVNYTKGKGKLYLNTNDQLLQSNSVFKLDYRSNLWSLEGSSKVEYLNTELIADSISVNNISTNIEFSLKNEDDLKDVSLVLKDSRVELLNNKLEYPKIEFQYTESDSLTKGFILSRPINVNLKSNVKYDSLRTYFTNLLNRYLNTSSTFDSLEYRRFDLELNVIEKDPIVEYYTNGIINFSDASLNLSSSNSRGINGTLHLPIYKYGKYTAKNIVIDLSDKNRQLYYHFNLEKAIWDSLCFPNISGKGIISDSLMTIDLQNINDKDSLTNSINLRMVLDSASYWNVMVDKDWRLLGRDWKVWGDGLRTNLKQIETANINFKKDKSEFSINTEHNNFIFEGRNLKIDNQIVHYTQFPFNGLVSFRLEGDRRDFEQMTFISELTIDSLKKDSIYYGQLKLLFTKPDSSLRIMAEGSLIKDNSKTQIFGEYDLNKSVYQTNISLNSFPLPLIEPFVENIDSLKGEINGSINSNLRDNKHHLDAEINLENNSFTYKPFQTNFRIEHGSIKVIDNQLVSDFYILDKENNTAEINGTIGLDSIKPLNLLLKTSKFILMDNKEEDNSEFNGRLIIGTNSKITGNIENPDIRAFISLEEGTSVNIFNEDNTVSSEQRNSDIFIFKNETDSLPIIEEPKDSSIFQHTTIKSNIDIDEKTKLKIVFDPINQDHLITEGGGNLSYELSENGDELLTGTYYITSGEYKTTFQELISKKFEIGENSTLVWFGKKENPRLNLHTYYNFRTSPYPLVASQNTLSEQEQQLYSGVQSFRLLMNIKGTLSKPELSFEIESVENSVSNSLTAINNEIERVNNDPSILNQQVFSILLFNKFLAVNGESAGSNSDIIVNSLGQLVTGELNKLTSEYIDFVDVDLGFSTQNNPDSVGSSYNTSIDIKIEKTFYNDRIRVKFGSVWDIQNNDNTSNKTYKNDFSVEYSITEDGRYRVKVFNKDDRDYDGTDITRNGISVMYSKDFNKFKYLFKKPKEEQIEE